MQADRRSVPGVGLLGGHLGGGQCGLRIAVNPPLIDKSRGDRVGSHHTANIPRHPIISPGVVGNTMEGMACLPEGWLQ